MNIKTVELRPHEIVRRSLLSKRAVSETDRSEQLELMFRTELWGTPLRELTHRYPANWIEAFKDRWFSARLKARFPVKFVDIKVESHAVFPEWVPNVDLGRVAVLHICNSKPGLFDWEPTVDETVR